MTDQEFNEIAGRIEAIARLATSIVAELEISGVIDGRIFTSSIRHAAQQDKGTQPYQAEMLKTLLHLSDSIDSARNNRQSAEWKRLYQNNPKRRRVVVQEDLLS